MFALSKVSDMKKLIEVQKSKYWEYSIQFNRFSIYIENNCNNTYYRLMDIRRYIVPNYSINMTKYLSHNLLCNCLGCRDDSYKSLQI